MQMYVSECVTCAEEELGSKSACFGWLAVVVVRPYVGCHVIMTSVFTCQINKRENESTRQKEKVALRV